MNPEIFQKVFDKLLPTMPEDWQKLVLYVGYTAGSYTMKYYTCGSDGVYTDCFSQNQASNMQLIKLFMDIDKTLAPERATLDDGKKWSVMTMMVASDGALKTEFDYADISEQAIAYEQNWKQKYIK